MIFDPVELVSSSKNVFVTKIVAQNDGATIAGVRLGEQIEISLEEDQYSGRQWAVKFNEVNLTLVGKGTFTVNPRNPQFGMRVFRFDCSGFGPGDIELHEVVSEFAFGEFAGSAIPGGKTFRVCIEVS